MVWSFFVKKRQTMLHRMEFAVKKGENAELLEKFKQGSKTSKKTELMMKF